MGKRKKDQERKKTTLVFDENKRKEFLCGFRKRKLERKKKAEDELKQKLKEEKKRIKQENKESYKKLVVSSRPIPDIEQLLQDEYEDEDVKVKIVELSSETLQKKNLFIGDNRLEVTEKDDKIKLHKKNVAKVNEIQGMGSDEEEDVQDGDTVNDDSDKIKTRKEIKRFLKKQATKKVQKSKAFQLKNKIEKIKNRKKSHQKKELLKKVPRKNKSKKSNVKRKH